MTGEVIQKLRALTGAGVMECKRALDDTQGDIEAAVRLIHERGLVKAEKKQGRTTGSGLVESYIHNERVGVLLELRSETDFVARSAPFRELAHELAMQIAAMDPVDPDALSAQPYIKDDSMTVGELVKRAMAKLGENIKVMRFSRYEI
ncbi:translation elongation factor Ts [Candidatus Jorgensenbacteria bacterium]|nr:translation elongation factor Ts [Candidatus Jorgensenbacteria bacterium]